MNIKPCLTARVRSQWKAPKKGEIELNEARWQCLAKCHLGSTSASQQALRTAWLRTVTRKFLFDIGTRRVPSVELNDPVPLARQPTGFLGALRHKGNIIFLVVVFLIIVLVTSALHGSHCFLLDLRCGCVSGLKRVSMCGSWKRIGPRQTFKRLTSSRSSAWLNSSSGRSSSCTGLGVRSMIWSAWSAARILG